MIPNKKMNYSEWLIECESDIINDFLIDNKEFERLKKEGYEEYLKYEN